MVLIVKTNYTIPSKTQKYINVKDIQNHKYWIKLQCSFLICFAGPKTVFHDFKKFSYIVTTRTHQQVYGDIKMEGVHECGNQHQRVDDFRVEISIKHSAINVHGP